MELRSAEQEVQSLRALYGSLCSSSSSNNHLPAFPELSTTDDDEKRQHPKPGNGDNHATSSSNSTITVSAVALLEQLETLRQKLQELQPRMDKFQKRLDARDPVTDRPRYGAQTARRVQKLLRDYHELGGVLAQVFGEEPVLLGELAAAAAAADDDNRTDGAGGANQPQKEVSDNKIADNTCSSNNNGNASSTPTATTSTTSTSIADSIRQLAAAERERQQRQAQQEQWRRQAQQEAQRAEEDRARRQQEEVAAERRRHEQEAIQAQARQAAELRAAAQRAREAEAAAERAWIEGIPHRKTLAGVREQLAVFVESSAGSKDSVTALHTIFAQIVAHPEQVNFRRIRRDHPRFLNDIGQHAGGRELLVAAGFELGMVEEVPSFVCPEPDIERNMDGWAAWFDLLKGTLELIEQEMIK